MGCEERRGRQSVGEDVRACVASDCPYSLSDPNPSLELSGSELLRSTADGLLTHMHAVRRRAMGEGDRASRSVADHIEIIEALEARDAELASRRVREHTMRLHDHIEERWTRLNNLDKTKQLAIRAAAQKIRIKEK